MERRASLEKAQLRRRYLQLEARKLARFERRACPEVESNLVVSDLDGERLRLAVGDVPIAVVENGVDIDFFSPAGDTVPKTILFVGGMDWYPNREAVRILVDEIWPRLIASDSDWRLTVVGRQPFARAARRGARPARDRGWLRRRRPSLSRSRRDVRLPDPRRGRDAPQSARRVRDGKAARRDATGGRRDRSGRGSPLSAGGDRRRIRGTDPRSWRRKRNRGKCSAARRARWWRSAMGGIRSGTACSPLTNPRWRRAARESDRK